MTDLAVIRIPVDSSDMVRAVKDAKALEMSVKTLVQAHSAGAINIKQFNNGIVQLKRSYETTFGVSSQKATAEIRRFTKSVTESVPHVNQAASELNRFGVVAQQTGYQVSDFIVQVQGGTNPLVAFSQQATQLAGLLYYMPERFMAARLGVLGFSMSVATAVSVVTIGIPLLAMLAMNFLSSGEDADKGAEGVDKYKEALDNLKSSIQSTQAEINKLTFGTEDAAVSGARKAMMDAQAEVARLTASQTKIRGQFAPTEDEKAAIEAAVKNYRDLVINLNELTAKQRAFAEAQNMLNGGLSVAAGIQKGLVYDKQVELQNAKELVQSYISQIEVMGRTKAEAEALAEAASQAGVSAQQLSHIDFSNISTAATEALRLAGNLGISLDTASRLAALGPQGIGGNDPSGGTYSGRGALNQSDILGLRVAGSFGYTTPPKSGGGAARVKKQTEAVKELTEAEKQRLNILKSIEGSLESGFMSMVDGTKSVKDAFKSMAREIIKELYRVLVVQRMVGAISGAVNMLTLPAGPSTGTLGLPKFATGGSMMPGGSYIVGENGPELVIPRHSGTVVNANQTAGATGGSSPVVINQSFNFTANGDESVKQIIRQQLPSIAEATKASVMDSKLRGGAYGRAFR